MSQLTGNQIRIINHIFRAFIYIASLCILILLGCTSSPSDHGSVNVTCEYELITPRRIFVGNSLPVVIRIPDINPRSTPVESLFITSSLADQTQAIKVKRGCGSVTLNTNMEGTAEISLTTQTGNVLASTTIEVTDRTAVRELSGTLIGDELIWDSTAVIRLTGDVTIDETYILEIGAGTLVILGDKVAVNATGNIYCTGTADAPVFFSAIDPDLPWGNIMHHTGYHSYSHTLFTNGGGDENDSTGHSQSQPVLKGLCSRIELDNVFILDNPGKAFYFQDSEFSLRNSLISRCDTGGELNSTLAIIDNCYFLDIPNDDELELDDDNDALYLSRPWIGGDGYSVISNSVFITGKDDGIDHNSANLKIVSCLIEDFDNEGVAGSNRNKLEIFNTLVLNCEQGIEAGYGTPEIIVNHCIVCGHETGFRFGDWYYYGCNGSLTVHNSISFDNSLHNVWNWDMYLNGPRQNTVFIDYSIVNDPEYDSGPGCLTGEPVFNEDYTFTANSIGYRAAQDERSIGLLEWGEEE